MKIQRRARGSWRIVHETLQTGNRIINRRCHSSPFELRMRVKKNLKISLLLFSVITVLYGTGFSSGPSSQNPDNSNSTMLYRSNQEYSSASEFDLSPREGEQLQKRAILLT